MKNKGRNTTKIGIRLDDAVVEALRERADKQGLTVGGYIKEQILKSYSGSTNSLMKGDLEAKLEKAGLNLEGNRIVEALQSKSSPLKEETNTKLPRYNPAIHKPGDTVLMLRGKKWMPYLIPELDSSGQPVPDYW